MIMKLNKLGVIIGIVLIAFNILVLPASIAGVVAVGVDAIITTTITETATTDLDFGSIDLDPAGDTIRINAVAGATTAATITNSSIVTGETSGLITITSGVVATVTVVYPAADVTLTSGANTLTIVAASITANSSVTGAGTDGINPFYVYLGGIIIIPAGQATGTYAGSMNITINYT